MTAVLKNEELLEESHKREAEMSLENIKQSLPDYAKDLRINLESLFNPENLAGLSEKQTYGSALSAAYAAKNSFLVENLLKASETILSAKDKIGIQTAVSLMGMNNVYYRSLHLAEDPELSKRPAGLRMMMMQKHGLSQIDFEIYSLAVSCLSGCGSCIKSHSSKLKQEGLSTAGLQSVIKISAVIQGINQSLNLKK